MLMKSCKKQMNAEVRAYVKGTMKQLRYLRSRWLPTLEKVDSQKKGNLT